MAYAMPAYAAPRSAPGVQKETPVTGEKVPVKPPLADPAAKQAWKAAPAVTWPKPQKAELGGSVSTLKAGFPVKLAPGTARAAQAAAPISVELLDTDRLGLAMRVTPGQEWRPPRRPNRPRPAWKWTTPASATPTAATTAPGCAW
ncbi:hypothetical protein ACFQQB_04560 [Nonomuraea rubra]|uniref:hypothetical protein n=1 Tax=Nonomuraea rubra TaxID=46180 RepID=UPI0036210C0B